MTRFFTFRRLSSSLRFCIVTAMACASSLALAQDGTFSWSAIGSGNQDANVGLSTSKTYLNAVDAGGWGGIVNGVTFARGNFNSNPSGSNYAVTGAGARIIATQSILAANSGKSSSTSCMGARRRSR